LAGPGQLTDLFYFAGPDAARTNMHAKVRAIGSDGLDRLQIRLRHLFGFIVRVTDLIAAELAFSADLTRTRHDKTLRNYALE
jgi:hypothetical protein